METEVHFISSGYRLEGRLHEGSSRAVVITHPHSLYGGNMHSPVVETIAKSFRQNGYTTLRFNFRGVEGSQGSFDEGVGEQEDVRRAIAYLNKQGLGPIELSGYSFGAWVNAQFAAESLSTIQMSMVSPPTAFMDFRGIHHLPGLTLVLTGSRDDIAPPEMLQRLVPIWNPAATLKLVPGADHFFDDVHLEALGHALREALDTHPAFASNA